MSSEERKWIDTQIQTYENAIRIAERFDNGEKLEEYKAELKRLKSA